MTVAKVNIYRVGRIWCYAAWQDDGAYDTSGLLGCDAECSTAQALAEAALQFDGATIHKVEDIPGKDDSMPPPPRYGVGYFGANDR